MPQAKDIKPDTRFFGMFVSRSSAGKSVAAFSFPKPILVIDSDLRKGFLGARHWLPLDGITINHYPPITTDWSEIEKEMSKLHDLFKIGQRPYATIIVDSITTLTRIFLRNSMSNQAERKRVDGFRMSLPLDYKFEGQVMLEICDYLRTFPCNVILNGHLVNVWGKDPSAVDKDGKPLEYQPDIVIGQELSIRHKLGENLLIYFDEVYRFTKSEDGRKHFVEFRSDIARTIYPFPNGPQDITQKQFYPYWLELIAQVEKFQEAKPR